MASSSRLLGADERVIGEVGPHWWMLARPVAASLAFAAPAAAARAGALALSRPLDLLLVAAMAAAVVWTVGRYVRWNAVRLTVTNERLVHRSGVIARRRSDVLLEHVCDLGYRQSPWQRVLGAGDLVVGSTGRSSRQIYPWLPDPAAIERAIAGQAGALQRDRMSRR